MKKWGWIGGLAILLWLPTAAPLWAQDASSYFVEAEISSSAPFIGQQIAYTLYGSLPEASAQTSAFPDFAGFWRTQLPDLSRVYLFPTRVGQVIIEPTVIMLPETVFRPAEVLRANEIVVRVQPLPAGAPQDFSGLVGQFEMTPTLDRQTLTLGEPVEFTLSIEGTGNLERFPAPELPVPEDWRVYLAAPIYRASEQANILIAEKTFTWLITPPSAGPHSFPPITLSYFDPAALAYRSLSTASVTIEVLQGTAPQPASAPLLSVSTSVPALKTIAGIVQPASAARIVDSPLFWLVWLIVPLLLTVTAARRLLQSWQNATETKTVGSPALQRTRLRLKGLSKLTPTAAQRQLQAAVYGYFGERLSRSPEGLTQEDLEIVLSRSLTDPSSVDQLLACLDEIDSIRYGQEGAADTAGLANRILKILSLVDAGWSDK